MAGFKNTLLTLLLLPTFSAAADRPLPLDKIKLPPGFHIEVYARAEGARSLTLSPSGTLFVGTRDRGKVYAIKNKRVLVIADDLDMPNGVAFKDGDLYVAEVSRILKFSKIEQHLERPPRPAVINDDYPTDQSHGWKFIAFGPDGWLYVPVGAPCNVCAPDDPIYSSITRLRPDGTGREIFAQGIRNTVGFDWQPGNNVLWFTDNGRDGMGDDVPPDELNRAPAKGLHFGFPACHGGFIADPEFGQETGCRGFKPPERKLGAHVAALGMRFYTGQMFPEAYKGRIFIAEHGSWNRSRKIGYRVMMVQVENNKAVSYEPFAEGWLQGENVWGRPVDVLVMPDGSLLVSDDKAGAVYRISYRPS